MDEVIGSILLLLLAVAAIIFAVPYALAVLLYTFPLFVFWLMLPVRIVPEPQLIIDPSLHPQLAKLRGEKRDAENRYDEVRYSDWGIRWSDNLDRFEERSVRGRDLNQQLEHWTAEADRIDREINRLSVPEWTVVGDWTAALRIWHRAYDWSATKRIGRKWGLLTFACVWFATELIGMAFPSSMKFFAFAWNPAPNILHPGIAIGAAAGWAAGICRVLFPLKSFAKRAEAMIAEYEKAKTIREQTEDKEIEESSREGAFEEEHDSSDDEDDLERKYEEEEPWYGILGVSPNATHDEINGAYRDRIKQYHPDRVSGLGEKLQLLAKVETQKLNAAREEGLSS